MKNNIVTLTDSYKLGHWQQYPDGTQTVYSYFESRTGAKFSDVVFFGLQYFLKEYLEGVRVTKEDIEHAAALSEAHFGNGEIFNRKGWEYILENHGGRLPVRICAVKEGSVIPVNNVLMTVENTDPNCYWLTNHLETLLSQIWFPCTVATLSRKTKRMMKGMLEETGCGLEGLPFMLHDFGFRGVSSVEGAGIGGAGHLVNFMGTDTVKAIETAMQYYGSEVCAYSVPASEHSVMTSMGPEGEAIMFDRMIEAYPTGIVSIVSDSYDIFGSVKDFVTRNKEKILQRDGKVVVRPDSGDPVFTVLKLLDILGETFGAEPNEVGFKVLPPQIGVIWGDGLDYDGIYNILRAMCNNGWAASNIVFGMGGGLLQKINRDTQRFAFKCSAQQRDGQWFDIFKEPLDRTKVSKRGKLELQCIEGSHGKTYRTFRQNEYNGENLLEVVFEDGELKREQTFEDIRKRAGI